MNYVPSVPKGFTDWVVANKDRIARAKSMPYFLSNNASVVNGILGEDIVPIVATSETSVAENATAIEETLIGMPKGAAGNSSQNTVQNNQAVQTKQTDVDKLQEIVEKCNNYGLDYNEVRDLPQELNTDDIIKRVAGGDQTGGSCASLSMAYAGNRCGYDVLDFRGGSSCDFFAEGVNYHRIIDLAGGKVTSETPMALLREVQEGKEYIFGTGTHSAIVRRINGDLQYLELQSPKPSKNGFHSFPDWQLYHRFGYKGTGLSSLLDIDMLRNNANFKKMLGYINTDKKKQMKGRRGSIK